MKCKRIVFKERNRVELEEYDLGRPKEGEVLIQTLYSAISPGTELAVLKGLPNTSGNYPFYPGYSACGVVVESKGKLFKEGQVVLYRGAHQSFAILDERDCHALKEGVDECSASAYRLASIALQGIRKAGIKLGDRVAVIGLGPIGQLAAQLAYFSGASEVVGIDPLEKRRKKALDIYVDAAYSHANGDECGKFDVVLESTGASQVILQAMSIAEKMGKVILLGSSRGVTEHVNFYELVHYQGIQLIGAHESNRAQADNHGIYCTNRFDEETVIKFINSGKLKLRPLAEDVYSYRDPQRAYMETDRDKRLLSIFKWKNGEM